MPDSSEQERITDSSFEIISEETAPIAQGQKKRYHIECQSTEDGTMIVRMFEQQVQLIPLQQLFRRFQISSGLGAVQNRLSIQLPTLTTLLKIQHSLNHVSVI